mmetsp:Transcript_14623/g.30911  ORF Transcript_14623/g.30911 Transcript_14623/m.30911 type:complete len:239 (+) Transcript_14623:207-923(+)
MALYYLEQAYDVAKEKAAMLHEESQRLFLSCSGGLERLGGEDEWDAPLALEIGGVGGTAEVAASQGMKWLEYIGVYKLENREVNGKPAWRHETRGNLWLAFDGVGWAAQPAERLGDRFGWMQLRDAGPPHMSKAMWQAAADDGSQWIDLPYIKCQTVTYRRERLEARPPAPAGSLEAGDGPCMPRQRLSEQAPSPSQQPAQNGASACAAASLSSPPPLPKPNLEYITKARSGADATCL